MSRNIETSPQQRAADSFVEVTEYMPQVPLAGMVLFVTDAIDMIRNNEATWEDLVSDSLQKAVARDALERTVLSHRANEVPNVQELSKKMNFALELVQTGANRAIAVLAGRDDTVETNFFEPVNPEETAKARNFLSKESNRQFVGELMMAIALKLGEEDHLTKLDEYKDNIVGISKEYAGMKPSKLPFIKRFINKRRVKKKVNAMNNERKGIMEVAAPKVMEALQSYRDHPGVLAFGNALVAGVPSEALFKKHDHPQVRK